MIAIRINPASAVYYRGIIRELAVFIGMERGSMAEAVEASAKAKVGLICWPSSISLGNLPNSHLDLFTRRLLPRRPHRIKSGTAP